MIRCDGHGVPELFDSILIVFPFDTYVENLLNLMEVMPGDNTETPAVEYLQGNNSKT